MMTAEKFYYSFFWLPWQFKFKFKRQAQTRGQKLLLAPACRLAERNTILQNASALDAVHYTLAQKPNLGSKRRTCPEVARSRLAPQLLLSALQNLALSKTPISPAAKQRPKCYTILKERGSRKSLTETATVCLFMAYSVHPTCSI